MARAAGSFDPEQIASLYRKCPQIESLRVTMKLPMDSSEEADRYRAFGGFTRAGVRYLTLDRRKLEAVSDLLMKETHDENKDWRCSRVNAQS